MRKFKKTIAVLMAIALSATALVGCGKKDESSAGKNDSATKPAADTGKVLNIYCWNDEFKGRFEAYYAPERKDMLEGIEVKFTINPNEGGVYQQKLDTALLNQDYAPADEKVDIFLVEADYALKYVNSNISLSMDSIGVTAKDMENQYQYTKDIVTDKNGKIKASSWQACPGLFTYRRSIAKKVLGTDDPTAVQEMLSDWTKFDAVAAKMKAAGYYMISGFDDTYRVYSNNISAPLVNSNNEIVIDPALDAYVKQMKDYTDKGYNEKTSLWGDQWKLGMKKDAKVFGYFWSTWGINFSLVENALADAKAPQDNNNGSFGDWAAVEGPQSYYWGGTWICACKGSDNLNLVADIIKTMTCNAELMKKNTIETLDMTNNKVAMNEIANDPNYKAAILGGQNHIALFVKSAEKIQMKNNTAFDQGITESFQGAMKDYFTGKVSKEKAMENFYKTVATRYPSLKVPA